MMVKMLFSAFISFLIYVSLVGSLGFDEIVIGIIIASVVGLLTRDLIVKNEKKVLSIRGWGAFFWYAFQYAFRYEVLSHWDVIKRIFTMKINPGIVRVPYYLDSEYGIISVGNSITNTPGTVVVELDEERRCYYVHWIDVVAPDPETCYNSISQPFEKHVRRYL